MEKLKGGDYKLIGYKNVCKMQRRKMPPTALRIGSVERHFFKSGLLSRSTRLSSASSGCGRGNLERDGRNSGVNHFQRTTTKYNIRNLVSTHPPWSNRALGSPPGGRIAKSPPRSVRQTPTLRGCFTCM